MELWTGGKDWINRPQRMGTGDWLHTNGELQLPPSMPSVESGERFQMNREWQIKPSAVASIESRGRGKGWHFPPGEFQSERLGAWFQAESFASSVEPLKESSASSGWPAQWRKKSIRSRAQMQEDQSSTKRNSLMALRNGKSELTKVCRVSYLCFSLSLNTCEVHFGSHSYH